MKEFGNGQILDTPRPQPWPLGIPEIGKCCTYIPNDISGLLPEELNTVNIKEHNNKKI